MVSAPAPQAIGGWNENNTSYSGRGNHARKAHEHLRLSKHGGPISRWLVRPWLRTSGFCYHRNADD
jgi:hypothetical protein